MMRKLKIGGSKVLEAGRLNVIVTGKLYDKDGNLKQMFVKHNLITNSGYEFLVNCLANETRPSAMRYIAVGKGTASPSSSNTALGSELFRKKCTYSYVSPNKFFSYNATFNAGEATGAITEAGLLNASSGGTLFDRVTFPVINKGALDIYNIDFTITFSEV